MSELFWGGRSFTITSMDDRKPTHGRASSIYEQLQIERSVSRASGEDSPSDEDGGRPRRMTSWTTSLYSEEDTTPQRPPVGARASVTRRAVAPADRDPQTSRAAADSLDDDDPTEWNRGGNSGTLSHYSDEDVVAQRLSVTRAPVERSAPDATTQYRRQGDESPVDLRRTRPAVDNYATDDHRQGDAAGLANERRSRTSVHSYESKTPYRQVDDERVAARTAKSDLVQRPSSPSSPSSLQLPSQSRQRRTSDIPKELRSWIGSSQDEYPEDSEDDQAEEMKLRTRSLLRRQPSAPRSSNREQEKQTTGTSRKKGHEDMLNNNKIAVDSRSPEREVYAEQRRGGRYTDSRSGESYSTREDYRNPSDPRIRGYQAGINERDAETRTAGRNQRLQGRDRDDH
ncbi:hypothetical protein BJ742DRAFT_778331 [Cladochytrium replicatum]|nr:hypothetical protein BJ742DRAFT_778331 [Cladochytrium replicatum]